MKLSRVAQNFAMPDPKLFQKDVLKTQIPEGNKQEAKYHDDLYARIKPGRKGRSQPG